PAPAEALACLRGWPRPAPVHVRTHGPNRQWPPRRDQGAGCAADRPVASRLRRPTMFKRLILVAALAVAPLGAAASDDRPIKVVVPYGAGGLIDVMTRIVTSRMTETL